MLVLARKPGQKIIVGDNITITLTKIEDGTAWVGIDAPRGMPVDREEVALDKLINGTRKPRQAIALDGTNESKNTGRNLRTKRLLPLAR